jgi:hypothetical protein
MTSLGLNDISTAALHAVPDPDEARLVLLDTEKNQVTTLDGAWWPRSTNLAADLPSLVAEFRRRGVRITRVSYHPQLWDPASRKVRVGDRVVRLGWFRTIDPHLVSLTGSNRERVELLVVPPDTGSATAARAMALAATRGNRSSPTVVLAAADASGIRSEAAPGPAASAVAAVTARQDALDLAGGSGREAEGGFSPR